MRIFQNIHIVFLIACSVILIWLSQSVAANSAAVALRYETEGEAFSRILEKNELVIGVKSDYPPWGMYSEDGSELIGLEIDLAKDLAKSLGVDLTLIPVNSRNRLQKVEEGAVDVVIATMGDSDSRREQSGLLLPHYYSSGVALLSREDIIFESWAQLVGRELCLTSGAYYNNSIIERYKIKPVFFDGTRDTGYGVKTGQCIGWAYDNTSLEQLIRDGTWSGYGFKLPIILPGAWAVAVSKAEQNSKFGAHVSNTIENWLRTGYILQLQDKWELPRSKFLVEQQEIFSRVDAESGNYHCVRSAEGNYPEDCQSEQILKTKVSIDAKPNIVEKVENALNLDFSPLFNVSVRQLIIDGLLLTLLISASSIFGSICISVVLLKLSLVRWAILRIFSSVIVSIFRSTPPLILMYLTFFGLGSVVYNEYGLTVPSIAAAILVFFSLCGLWHSRSINCNI